MTTKLKLSVTRAQAPYQHIYVDISEVIASLRTETCHYTSSFNNVYEHAMLTSEAGCLLPIHKPMVRCSCSPYSTAGEWVGWHPRLLGSLTAYYLHSAGAGVPPGRHWCQHMWRATATQWEQRQLLDAGLKLVHCCFLRHMPMQQAHTPALAPGSGAPAVTTLPAPVHTKNYGYLQCTKIVELLQALTRQQTSLDGPG